ncbi:hypothetical protein JOM56_015705 [Amanita muscaria]
MMMIIIPIEPSGSELNGPNDGTDDDRPSIRPVPGRALLKERGLLVHYVRKYSCRPTHTHRRHKCSDPGIQAKNVLNLTPSSCLMCLTLPLYTAPYLPLHHTKHDDLYYGLDRSTSSVPNLHASSSTTYVQVRCLGAIVLPLHPPFPTIATTPTGGTHCAHPFYSRSLQVC